MKLPAIDMSKKSIELSWKRCHSFGLKTRDQSYDEITSGNQLKIIKSRNYQLLKYGEPFLEKLAPFIKKSGQIALLIDPSGHIVSSIGDPSFATHAQKVQLQVGANWHEEKKGTNAIGLALYEKKAVCVYGNDHFYEKNRFLTCTAAPIYSPTGEFLGVIDISGNQAHFHPYSYMIACLTADAIQNRMIIDHSHQENLMTAKELERTSKHHPLPLLSLDSDQRIIRANRSAKQLFGENCIGEKFQEKEGYIIESITDQAQKVWRSLVVYSNAPKRTKNNRGLYTFSDIIGSCPKIYRLKELAQKASFTDFPILINGESGTGKELFAQSIHTASLRATKPFIAINCSAIPDALVESELFGYEKGAFTGANAKGNKGKFEAADQGTIFLDEIGDMSLRAQAALLRVLQEKVITPVGSTRPKQIDVRIIAATHRNLQQQVKVGHFREDLYFRLKGI